MRRGPGGRARSSGAACGLVRRRDERGALTAEAALVLPVLVLVTLALAWVVSLVGLRLQAVDAAREAARVAARGEPTAVAADAARVAAPRATVVEVTVHGGRVTARVGIPALTSVPAGTLRKVLGAASGLVVSAESVAVAEQAP